MRFTHLGALQGDVYVEMVLLFPTSKLHNYYTRVQDQGPFIKKAPIQAQRLTQ